MRNVSPFPSPPDSLCTPKSFRASTCVARLSPGNRFDRQITTSSHFARLLAHSRSRIIQRGSPSLNSSYLNPVVSCLAITILPLQTIKKKKAHAQFTLPRNPVVPTSSFFLFGCVTGAPWIKTHISKSGRPRKTTSAKAHPWEASKRVELSSLSSSHGRYACPLQSQ